MNADLFKYKGYGAAGSTHGFHLSVNAEDIAGYKTTSYDLEGVNKGKLESKSFRNSLSLYVEDLMDGISIEVQEQMEMVTSLEKTLM